MRLVPADRTSCSTVSWAPFPSATIVITAATPMIIPSIVRIVRSALRPRARMARRTLVRSIRYSYRRDWIGSRRAACRAGYQPKKMPTAAATLTDTTTAPGEMVVDQCR